MLLLRKNTAYTPCLDPKTLEGILTFPDVGPLVLQRVFEDGYRTVLQLALVSRRIWQATFCGTVRQLCYPARRALLTTGAELLGLFRGKAPQCRFRGDIYISKPGIHHSGNEHFPSH